MSRSWSPPPPYKEEFLDDTLDVWHIPPASATRVGHPAPFPVELPARCIPLYTYLDDVVLDPFTGSGTTAVAAQRAGRRWIDYDTDLRYVELTRRSVTEERPAKPRRSPDG